MSIETESIPDAELVRQAQDGDVAAYRRLARRHLRALYLLTRSIVRDTAAAEELVPRACLTAYRHLDRFDARRSFLPWLLKIGANLSFHALRSARRAQRGLHLAAAGDRLPLLTRAILTLQVAQGMRYEEVGETLGVPPETVLERLRDARHTLHSLRPEPARRAARADGDPPPCEDRAWLDAYVDQQLSRLDRRRVEQHLAVCGPCHEEADAVLALRLAISAEVERMEPSGTLLVALAARLEDKEEMARGQASWLRKARPLPRRPLPFGMESWPQLVLGGITVAAVVFLVHLVEARRRASLSSVNRPVVQAGPETASRGRSPSAPDPLRIWGAALVQLLDSQVAAEGSPSPSPPQHREATGTSAAWRDAAWLLDREEERAFSDSLWMEAWRLQARALADEAISTGDADRARSALMAYYRVVSRAGRILLPEPARQAQALHPDRTRIEGLVRLLPP